MQREIPRLILEPISPFPAGADGVVDLYLMPAYDDIARLVRVDGRWDLYYAFRGEKQVAGMRNNPAVPLNEENFLRVLESIGGHAV